MPKADQRIFKSGLCIYKGFELWQKIFAKGNHNFIVYFIDRVSDLKTGFLIIDCSDMILAQSVPGLDIPGINLEPVSNCALFLNLFVFEEIDWWSVLYEATIPKNLALVLTDVGPSSCIKDE